MERRLAGAKIPLATALRAAKLNRSTWDRWKAAKTSPRMNNWDAVCRAVETLVPVNAQSTASTDSTTPHADGSSSHPNADTEQLLEQSASADQGGQARDGVSSSSSDPHSMAPNGAKRVA